MVGYFMLIFLLDRVQICIENIVIISELQ